VVIRRECSMAARAVWSIETGRRGLMQRDVGLAPWQRLNFLPEPHGHGSFRPGAYPALPWQTHSAQVTNQQNRPTRPSKFPYSQSACLDLGRRDRREVEVPCGPAVGGRAIRAMGSRYRRGKAAQPLPRRHSRAPEPFPSAMHLFACRLIGGLRKPRSAA
jgi:hypothetical protein